MSQPGRPTFIDLFCGCGGYTLGMLRAGFECRAAIDFNGPAMTAFRTNFLDVPHALEKDLTKFSPEELANIIGSRHIDVIVGGPPCQGFSTARKRDGTNQGTSIIEDPRRYLYQEFLKYVKFFQPKVFVMENVLGIRSAAGGEYFRRLQTEARNLGYRVHPQMENAVELGVPQKRKRQLFIGTRIDQVHYFYGSLQKVPRASANPSLWEAIGDLPSLRAGECQLERDYDMDRRHLHVERYGKKFIYDVLEVQRAPKLTSHCARPHSERDLRDFSLLKEGESSARAMRRGVEFEFPYDKKNFKDRYTRQHRAEPCSTIVAHMSKDGLMFIHPTQNRSLTPREAARVQTFPDWFQFPVPRTQQFRMIGNAVPPLVAEAIGLAVKAYLDRSFKTEHRFSNKDLPYDQKHAVGRLKIILDATNINKIRNKASDEFKRDWLSIEYLYPGLHPEAVLEGNTQSYNRLKTQKQSSTDPHLSLPCHMASGWPIALVPVVREAWRRYKAGELKDIEFYCSEAAALGIRRHALNPRHTD